MNHAQLKALREFFTKHSSEITAFHHGDCIGADVEANDIARTFGIETCAHPPQLKRYRAYAKSDVWYAEKPYIERNHDIVDICEVLLVAPREQVGITRSGTWATYRFAIAIGRPTIILERF